MKKKFLTFNDGIANIYNIINNAEKGDRPTEKLNLLLSLRFSYNTIGIKRNYEAMQQQVKLSELICTPMHREISPQDVVVIGQKQYSVVQIQHKPDTLPPSSLLSLSRLEEDYDY